MKQNKHAGFRVLSSNIELHTAALDKQIVLVFDGQELVQSGYIRKVTDDFVRIKDEWYVRSKFTFTLSD